MAQYCQTGDTARVTFPNGSVQDFTDTPIEVICENLECALISAEVFADRSAFGFPSFTVRFTARGNYFVYVQGNNLRVNFDGCDFNGNLTGNRSDSLITGSFFPEPPILTITELGTPPDKKITILGNSGELFTGIFSNCDYSVECLAGCPPNTLDCGDCCLSCSSIFNQFSDLRLQLARLK